MLNKLKPTIAIVDSGIGGIAVLNKLISKNSAENYIYFADNLYMPYGNMTKAKLKQRVNEIINALKPYDVDKIIIACNTASSVLKEYNTQYIETLPFDNDTNYLATNLTKKANPNKNIIADSNLAKLIELNIFNKPNLEKIVCNHVTKYKLNKLPKLTLACTHYELVADYFKKYCPHTKISCNSDNLCAKINENKVKIDVSIHIITSKPDYDYYKKISKLITRGN